MKKGALTVLSFLLLPALSGCSLLGIEAPWTEVKVPEGNFAVECPNNLYLDNDEGSSTLLCRGEAFYTVNASEIQYSGDETVGQEALKYANTYAQASFSKIISSETVERNGRLVQEIIGIQKSGIPENERNSAYHKINGERLLIFERTFYADKKTYTLSADYEVPSDPNAYQQVLDKNKEKRERFFNSFRFLEGQKPAN